MARIVKDAAPYCYALLRMIGALLYACHGGQKLLGLFGGMRGGGTVPLVSLLGVAGSIELGAGVLIACGVADPPGGVSRQWGDGLCLLVVPCAPQLLADPERWGGCSAELLSVPLHRESGGWAVESGPGVRASGPDRASGARGTLPSWVIFAGRRSYRRRKTTYSPGEMVVVFPRSRCLPRSNGATAVQGVSPA